MNADRVMQLSKDAVKVGKGEPSFICHVNELCGLLDLYTLDEVQVLIMNDTFCERTYKKIRAYLIDRARNECCD